MTRTAWLPLLFVLLGACGDDDERTECRATPVVDDDAIGNLAVETHEGEPVFAQSIRPEADGRLRISFGGAEIYLRRPARAGTYDLEVLGAELCTFKWTNCVPVIGTVDVTVTEPNAFDGVVEATGTSEIRDELTISGTSRFVYRESTHDVCWTYSEYEGGGCNCGAGFPGPGQL